MMNRVLKYKMFENPDNVKCLEPRQIYASWSDCDTLTFGYYLGVIGAEPEMRIMLGGCHMNLLDDEEDKRFVDDDGNLMRDNAFNFPGRLWFRKKVITFWIYPTPSELPQLLKDIKIKYDTIPDGDKFYTLDFSEPEWLIEVLDDEMTDPKDYDWQGYTTKCVPLSNYTGSNNRSEEELKIPHLMNWEEKQELKKKGWGKGFGSDLTAWDGKNPLAWRQAKYQENMKVNFKSFINEEKINFKIYCDMDDVLTDFNGDVYNKILKDFNKENDTDIKNTWIFEEEYGSEIFWELINLLGLEFWSEMSWMKDGKELWNYIKNFDGVEILSKPSKDKISREGKRIWCKREIGDVKVNLSFNKEKFATPNSILIDDYEKNIIPWRKKGGIGILHKNTKDTIRQLKIILGK